MLVSLAKRGSGVLGGAAMASTGMPKRMATRGGRVRGKGGGSPAFDMHREAFSACRWHLGLDSQQIQPFAFLPTR